MSTESVCANPTCGKPGKLLCSGCGDVQYCCKECQKAHWADHKSICKAKSRTVERMKEADLRSVLCAKAETFDNKVKKNTLLNKAENPDESVDNLRKLAKEHVKDSEVEDLLAAALAKQKKKEDRMSNTATKHTGGKKIKPPSNFQPGTPSPDQLRQQAAMMRQNPDAVRKAQAAFANLSDEQIRAYADQLEQTANDPSMMKEVERMSQMNDGDRQLVTTIQQGLSGGVPITDEWITEIVTAIKTKPELFKSMFGGKGALMGGGISDDQISSYIDMASGMSITMLKAIAYGIWYIAKAAKPLTEVYNVIDKYTLGSARYIFFGLFAMVLYYVSMFLFAFVKLIVFKLYAVYLTASGGSAVVSTATTSAATSAATAAAAAASASASESTVAAAASQSASSIFAKVAGAGAAAAGARVAANAAAGGEEAAVAGDSEF